MTFRDKRNNELIEANSYAEWFAFSHNSNYELVEIVKEAKPKEDKKKKKDKPKEDKKEK